MRPLTLRFNHSELLAVPAAHFRHAFAWHVNRICANPDTRPEAVAVELSPHTTAAAQSWLKELCSDGSAGARKLPILLGMTHRNQLIRPSSRDKALKLLRTTGRDLSELPPKLVCDELSLSGQSLLCLCPTDSIIEAIRCAIELEVPLYGVDLEETADGQIPAVAAQDPLCAIEDLAGYAARNAGYAERQRDDAVDTRRESAMAARLKTLLLRHRRVLFTCGLAHWSRIQALLADSAIEPALLPDPPPSSYDEFKKVVLHPLLAVHYMDLFPPLAVAYERRRKSAAGPAGGAGVEAPPDAGRVYSAALLKATRCYFSEGRRKPLFHAQDLNALSGFEAYLKGLCRVQQRIVPDLFMTVSAAQETMSRQFVEAVADGFMNVAWETIDKHSGSAMLMPASGHDSAPLAAVYADTGNPPEGYFYLGPVSGCNRGKNQVHIPFDWAGLTGPDEDVAYDGNLYTWSPWNNIISSMSLRAGSMAFKRLPQRRVEVFAGSLIEGIDVKATLRACSRGSEDVYVKSSTLDHQSQISSDDGGEFPVVWLFDPAAGANAEWIALYHEFCSLSYYIQDRGQFEHIVENRGDKLVGSIGYGRRAADQEFSLLRSKARCDRYNGIVFFMPLCWTDLQTARWAELTGYGANPICQISTLHPDFLGDLKDFYAEQHDIRLGQFHWTSTLILFALPFAKRLLPVVAPDYFNMEPVVLSRAKRYGVEIAVVPLSSFQKEALNRISLCQMAPGRNIGHKCVYPPWMEEQTGEHQAKYLDSIPRSWLEFGL